MNNKEILGQSGEWLSKNFRLEGDNAELRPWQVSCFFKSAKYLADNGNKTFFINAAPGAGKTIASCLIAKYLLENKRIEQILVVAPSSAVLSQWKDDIKDFTNRTLIEPNQKALFEAGNSFKGDIRATWQSLPLKAELLQQICRRLKTLVIFDEHHHSSEAKSWGVAASTILEDAAYSLILSGTPVRSDGHKIAGVDYDIYGNLSIPDEGIFELNYGDAINYGYCRPITFIRKSAVCVIKKEVNGVVYEIRAEGGKPTIFPDELLKAMDLKEIKALRKQLDFVRLSIAIDDDLDTKTPSPHSFTADILRDGIERLNYVRRFEKPNAGGIIIARDQAHAKYYRTLLNILDNAGRAEDDQQLPQIVISEDANSNDTIDHFRKDESQRWIIAVAKISEGVDIKRLRVMVLLTNKKTELFFRQVVARCVRKDPLPGEIYDLSNAYVIIPADDKLDTYAERIEREMEEAGVKPTSTPTQDFKECPKCGNGDVPKRAKECPCCGYEWPAKESNMIVCDKCHALNEPHNHNCIECGALLKQETPTFVYDWDSFFRDGGKSRGNEFTNEELEDAEELAPFLDAAIKKLADKNLLMIRQMLTNVQLPTLVLQMREIAEHVPEEILKKMQENQEKRKTVQDKADNV